MPRGSSTVNSRVLHGFRGGPSVALVDDAAMTLRCVFHVSPTAARPTEPKAVRPRMPSLLDLDIEYVDEQPPRGASFETWNRARGWASED